MSDQMAHLTLKQMFEKARATCPFYATSPVGANIDPKEVTAKKKYGNFMRLPLGNKINRWCFINAAYRDSFVHDYQEQGAQEEE
jgi:hypothetical protein